MYCDTVWFSEEDSQGESPNAVSIGIGWSTNTSQNDDKFIQGTS